MEELTLLWGWQGSRRESCSAGCEMRVKGAWEGAGWKGGESTRPRSLELLLGPRKGLWLWTSN